MKITFTDAAKAEIIGFLVDQGGKLPKAAEALDSETNGLLSEAMAGGRFEGKEGQQAFVVLPKGASAKRALLVGAGKADSRDDRALERIGATVYKAQANSGFKSLALMAGGADEAARLGLGAKLAAYRFDEYRTKLKDEDKPSLSTFSLVTEDTKAAKAAFKPLDAGADGTYLARDLVNMPPNDLYPGSYAEKIETLAEHGLEVEVLGEKELSKLGMGCLLGVGMASERQCKMAVIRWMGAKSSEPYLALIGKGITYDSGGLSIKTNAGMHPMKGDMAGSAAVVGAMKSIALRKTLRNVVGIVPLVENMIAGNALRPADVLQSMSGQTVEIRNTDAEGRLILCDAMTYAQEKFECDTVIDIATLTGAVRIATGYLRAGVFSNQVDLDVMDRAAAQSGEYIWRLPLDDYVEKYLKSDVADFSNSPLTGALLPGSAIAAKFLQKFVNPGQKWIHLDIAGVGFDDQTSDPRYPSWGTGWGVRLLSDYAEISILT